MCWLRLFLCCCACNNFWIYQSDCVIKKVWRSELPEMFSIYLVNKLVHKRIYETIDECFFYIFWGHYSKSFCTKHRKTLLLNFGGNFNSVSCMVFGIVIDGNLQRNSKKDSWKYLCSNFYRHCCICHWILKQRVDLMKMEFPDLPDH